MGEITIGPYRLGGRSLLAPMAGVTDLPFRSLCRRMGAALTAGEMISSDPRLWDTRESRRRRDQSGEAEPRVVQIAGSDPVEMADAARRNVDAGAQVIDINMGCPARKVCSVAAGSALMADEPLAIAIVDAVARAVDVPVTVKLRTGPSPSTRNAVRLARAFEAAGAAMLAVHGRTRACAFGGRAEYATVGEVKAAVSIPVVANGDIDSPQAARDVLRATRADAVMIGRAAQGRPWIFREIAHFLETGQLLPEPGDAEIAALLREHLLDHYAFHGEVRGVRSARKHVGWYLAGRPGAQGFLRDFNALDDAPAQLAAVERFLVQAGSFAAAKPVSGAANDTRFLRSDAA